MGAKDEEVLKELVTIRKLLLVGLLQSGLSQAQLAAALGVHRTMIGKMFPTGALAELAKKPRSSKKAKGDPSDE